MGLTTWWISFLVIFIIAKVGFNSSLVFYDSMLSDVTAPERMDRVSSSGYAWGYAGSCIPFIVSLVFVLGYQKMGLSFETGMMIAFAVVAVWWLVMSLPLMKQYRQVHYVERKPHAMRESVGRIIETLRSVRKQKKIFLFLIAFFSSIDGVYTIIDMATAYGSALWKRSILYGNDGGRTGFPGFWEYKHRGIRYRISFPCRSTVFYENRAQWIGKYEKSGERYHGTADVP